jgi:hypothetical protein
MQTQTHARNKANRTALHTYHRRSPISLFLCFSAHSGVETARLQADFFWIEVDVGPSN